MSTGALQAQLQKGVAWLSSRLACFLLCGANLCFFTFLRANENRSALPTHAVDSRRPINQQFSGPGNATTRSPEPELLVPSSGATNYVGLSWLPEGFVLLPSDLYDSPGCLLSANGRLLAQTSEAFGLTDDESACLSDALEEMLKIMKEYEARNAYTISTEEGEFLKIPPYPGGREALQEILQQKLVSAFNAENCAALANLFTHSFALKVSAVGAELSQVDKKGTDYVDVRLNSSPAIRHFSYPKTAPSGETESPATRFGHLANFSK